MWATGQPPIEVHGTAGSLQLPHPAWHGGPLRYAAPRSAWEPIPVEDNPLAAHNWPPAEPTSSNYRGIGLAEMIEAMELGRPHRASAELAIHVVEAADAIIASAGSGSPVSLHDQPAMVEPIGSDEMARLYDATR